MARKINISIVNDDLKDFVLDRQIIINLSLNNSLGNVLHYRWDNSKSTNHNFWAITMRQKFLLLKGLHSFSIDDIKKIQYFQSVCDFFSQNTIDRTSEEFYSVSQYSDKIMKDFDLWYSGRLSDEYGDSNDGVFMANFSLLFLDVLRLITEFDSLFQFRKNNKKYEEEQVLKRYQELYNALMEQPNGKEIIKKLEKKTKLKF